MLTTFTANLAAQIETETLGQLLSFVIILTFLTIVLYIAGRAVVGKKRALFSDAFVISILGTIVLIVCLRFFGLIIGVILSLIVWLLLVRHYYETGLLGAIAVGIMAVIVSAVILVIIGAVLGISDTLLKWLLFL